MSKLDPYLAPNPAKAAVERFWLWYTPVWGILAGVVMLGGFANHWTDLPLFAFCLLLGLGAFLGPIFWRHESERNLLWFRTVAFRYGLSVVLISFFGNYSWSIFFYDVLHMHYGFNTQWNIRNNPIQMYLITVAYFATYAVLIMMAFRGVKRHLANAPKAIQWLGMSLVPFVVAGLETALNANPWLGSLFCYDDMSYMLTFGTFAYGIAFVFCLPVWLYLDERRDRPTTSWQVVIWTCAAMYGTVLAYDVIRYEVAPHLTDVREGAWKHNLRDFDDSCLETISKGAQ